jgi:hypothetical protein
MSTSDRSCVVNDNVEGGVHVQVHVKVNEISSYFLLAFALNA